MARFYRIVRHSPPERIDFLSYQQLGLKLRFDNPMARRYASGISVYESEADARARALLSPHLGQFLAVLDVPEDGTIQYERTGRQTGHWTLWGNPDALRNAVVSTIRV
jgi:hypothetical protein